MNPLDKKVEKLLFVVFLNDVVNNGKFNARLLEHFNRISVCMVAFLTYDPFDARVDYHHGTCSTRRHLTKESATFKWNPKAGCLENSVLLSVQGTYTVLTDFAVAVGHLAQVMPCFVAVR